MWLATLWLGDIYQASSQSFLSLILYNQGQHALLVLMAVLASFVEEPPPTLHDNNNNADSENADNDTLRQLRELALQSLKKRPPRILPAMLYKKARIKDVVEEGEIVMGLPNETDSISIIDGDDSDDDDLVDYAANDIVYLEPSAWVHRHDVVSEHSPHHYSPTDPILIPQMSVFLEQYKLNNFIPYTNPNIVWCFHQLAYGQCTRRHCNHLHDTDTCILSWIELVKRLSGVLPVSLRHMFCKLINSDLLISSSHADNLSMIGAIYGKLLMDHADYLKEAVVKPLKHYNAHPSCTLPFMERLLFKDIHHPVEMLETWYESARIDDRRVLSVFDILLDEYPDHAPLHRLICEHCGPNLHRSLPGYRPPDKVLWADRHTLSAYLNCLDSIDDLSLPDHNVDWVIAKARWLCEHGQYTACTEYLEGIDPSCFGGKVIHFVLFRKLLVDRKALYTRWFLPSPYQYLLDYDRLPVVKNTLLPTPYDSFILRWHNECFLL